MRTEELNQLLLKPLAQPLELSVGGIKCNLIFLKILLRCVVHVWHIPNMYMSPLLKCDSFKPSKFQYWTIFPNWPKYYHTLPFFIHPPPQGLLVVATVTCHGSKFLAILDFVFFLLIFVAMFTLCCCNTDSGMLYVWLILLKFLKYCIMYIHTK